MKNLRHIMPCFFIFLILTNVANGSKNPGEAVSVKVFIDFNDIDISYLKQNFNQVIYVINREDANVHMLVTTANGAMIKIKLTRY